jgi:hypothetical protein
MECQMNAKLNQRKKAGVKSRNRIRLTVFQKDVFFNMADSLRLICGSEIRQEKATGEVKRKKACGLVRGLGESVDGTGGMVRSLPVP